MGFFSKLRGTMESLFRIGKDGPQLKNTSGTLMSVRNNTDSALANMEGADPTADQHFLTRLYFDNNNAAATGNITKEFATITTSSVIGTTTIPAGARVLRVRMILLGLYTNGDETLTVDTAVGGQVLMAASDNAMLAADGAAVGDIYQTDVDFLMGPGETIDVTLGGTPAAGSCRVEVEYVDPDAL